MHFHVLTLFPGMIEQGMNTSIMGRAIERGYISLKATDIRDYAANKHNKVDDTPYGGGAGMVMQAAPVYGAYEAVKEQIGYRPRVIYLTPQGSTFSQPMAEEFAKEQDLVFLCGHYEGIDERVLEEIVTDYVSIGDYVLTGGELPALYRQIGESFDRLDTWSKYMITSYEDAQHYIGKKAEKNRKIYNGMIKTYFYQYLGPKPPRREKN